MRNINDRLEELGAFVAMPDDDRIICRCEEVTKGEIRMAVHQGMYTMSEVRRFLRTGMGLCQGQSCEKTVKSIIAGELGISPAELEPSVARSPMRPTEMGIYAKDGGNKE